MMVIIKVIDTKVSDLKVGDAILYDGEKVTITGIGKSPDGRKVIFNRGSTITLDPDDTVNKVVD